MLHVVLFQPEIPQNTGNIGRTCAVTQTRLHLIHPLGFELSDKYLKRSGMDYWRHIDLHEHVDWQHFMNSEHRPKRLWLFTTKTQQSFWDVTFCDEDGLVFGQETAGAPPWLHTHIGAAQRLRIPHKNQALRSLNLSTSVGIAIYTAQKQTQLLS